MRIAVMIISLALTLMVGLQSCALFAGGSMTRDQSTAGGGAMGILVALLFVVGGAFAIGIPRVSMFAFGVAGLLGIAVGTGGSFKDMTIWGIVAFGLAVMSYFGDRELQRLRGGRQ
jgi:hypothetical protein